MEPKPMECGGETEPDGNRVLAAPTSDYAKKKTASYKSVLAFLIPVPDLSPYPDTHPQRT